MAKRLLDIVGALLALVLAAPLLLLVAIAIKLDSPGPVFFTQTRVGWRGRPFRMCKFRSMVAGAEETGLPITGRDDARVTRVGRVLRTTRLDELPQLLNVLRGEMSLVGPRPEVPTMVARYTGEEREVLEARPGIAGPTQLAWLDEADRYPPGADIDGHYAEEFLRAKLRSDLEYVRTRSLARDVGYLLRTPVALAKFVLSTVARESLVRKVWRFGVDCGVVGVAHLAAFLIRFEFDVPASEVGHLVYGLPITCASYAIAFGILRTYRGIWRFASVEDLWRIAQAVALGGTLHAFTVFLLGWRPYPRSVVVLTVLLAALALVGLRAAARSAWLAPMGAATGLRRRRLVIVGAGSSGEAIAREIRCQQELGFELVGFVDDNERRRGETIHGVPVLGATADLPTLALSHALDEAIIAIQTLSVEGLRRIGERCAAAGLRFRVLPSLTQLVRGEGRLRYLRPLNAEELLGRERADLDRELMAAFVGGKRVMVTGAGGSIGSELCRQVARLGAASVVLVERAENALHAISLEIRSRYPCVDVVSALADVKHVPHMGEIFVRNRPELVFHTAAYKHVPILEEHPGEAVLNNVVGTRRLAEMATQHGVRDFVLISTDKAANPISLMGATKRLCEQYVTALGRARASEPARTRFRVVRFGNVLGSAGSVLNVFQQQIENGDAVTITDPGASRYLMTVGEAVALVLHSVGMGGGGDMFVLDMGSPVKIGELADDLVLALGLSPGEVPRRYVGLRAGEKLHEDLVNEGEEVECSAHERVFVIRSDTPPLERIEALVDELESLAVRGDVARLLNRIQEVVPTYRAAQADLAFEVAEAGERYRVLVVEDDEQFRAVLADALGRRYEVALARSAREGFERAAASPLDLVLLDVALPDGSGLEMCRALRDETRYGDVAVIVMTGFGAEYSAATALGLGADDYLAKPLHLDELMARIAAVLRRRAGRRARFGR